MTPATNAPDESAGSTEPQEPPGQVLRCANRIT